MLPTLYINQCYIHVIALLYNCINEVHLFSRSGKLERRFKVTIQEPFLILPFHKSWIILNERGDIQFIGEDQIFEQGLGMSYNVDFNTLSELIEKLFNKKLTLEGEGLDTPFVPDDTSFPANFNEDKKRK